MTQASQVNMTRLSLLNARSLCSKGEVINDLITECELDLLALTETWMNEQNEQRTVASLLPAGYGITVSNREKKRGGGVALVHRTSIKCKRLKQHKALSFESLQVMVTIRQKSFHLCIVYRPPQLLSATQFHLEFADFFTHLMCSKSSVVVMGDFNVHWDDASHADTRPLVDLLSSTSTKQHVTVATHSAGHILDLVITRADDTIMSSVETGSLISDHSIVHCKLATQQPPRPTKTMKLRKWRNIQHEAVDNEIGASDLCTPVVATRSTDGLLHEIYDSTLKAILDAHAPEKNVTLTLRPNCAWINDTILQGKRKRRRLETTWRRTGLAVDKQAFTEQRNLVYLQIEKARSAYYEARVTECGNDQKKLFGVVESLLKAPSVNGSDHSPDEFNTFFTQKVLRIHDTLGSAEHSREQDPVTAVNRFNNFSPVTLEEIVTIVKKSPSKTCPLDPWPTWMVKQHLNSLAPVIQRVVNESLCTGVFPELWKRALIRPLLKKPSLDAVDMKNFRPVANLPFLSKVVEKCVARQLNSFLQESGLFPQFQSAYRENHSVETALLRVQNDVLSAIDNHKGVLLVLLDLSCAFDTISHTMLLHRLKCRFGLDERVLQWFESYLSGRSQRVLHNERLSESSAVPHGVPQGSVLGPIMFSLYTSPMCELIEQRGVNLHLYADDTQIYLTFTPRSAESAASAMELSPRPLMISNLG
jgi:exonuclease III